MPDTHYPEQRLIVRCLTVIRRRHFGVRLVERLALALQWSAAVALCLTGARLLREPLSWESLPWCAMLLSLIPLAGAYWFYRNAATFQHLGLSTSLLRGTAILTALLAAAMLALLFLPIGRQIPVWSVPAATIIAFMILAAATTRMIDVRAAAIYVDQQIGLHERVSTALELLTTPPGSSPPSAFHAPVIASALDACQQVRTARIGYRRLDSRAYALAALVAIAAASLTLVPPAPARAVALRKPNTILVSKSKDLHDLLQELEDKKLPNDKVTAEALKPLQNAVTRLQEGTMSQIESSALLSEAKAQLKREQEAMAAADKVQDTLKAMSSTKDLANAADALKRSEMQAAEGNTAGDQRQSAAEALKAAAGALADKMSSGKMSDAEKKELADKLQAAAGQAGADPQLQKDLQSAADAARNGNSRQLAQSMQSAGQRLGQQSAANQMSRQAMNRAMAEIDRMQGNGNQSTMGQPGEQQAGSGQGQQGEGRNGDSGGLASGNTPGSSGGQQQPGGGAPGSGQGPADVPMNNSGTSGNGSTMMEARGSPDRIQGQPLGGKGTFVRVYDSTSINTSGNQEKVGSHINPLQSPAVGTAEVLGAADKNDPTIRTYKDVLPDARQQAMDDMARQEYPPQYQEIIRQFYNETPKK
jgi:hypothetical protein